MDNNKYCAPSKENTNFTCFTLKSLHKIAKKIGIPKTNNKKKLCLSPPNIKNESGYYGFSNNKDIKATWWNEI